MEFPLDSAGKNGYSMLVGRNIVIKRIGDRAYLPTSERLEIEQPANILNRSYAMCRITNFDEATGTLSLAVLSDIVTEDKFCLAIEINSDVLMASNIKKLTFNKVSPSDVYFTPANNNEDVPDRNSRNNNQFRSGGSKEHEFYQRPFYEQINIQSSLQVTEIAIELPINDIVFEDGRVSFEYYIHQIGRRVHFDIPNSFIKKEFDSIKNYFSKVFGTKKFTISISVESRGKDVINHSASSPQVSRIDSSLFEIVEEYLVEDRFLNSSSEEEIYNLIEKADELSRLTGSDKIREESWLLDKFFTKERTKHYDHLRHLSSKHVRGVYNLYMTGKPISFIFLLPYRNGYCLIWETYSTEEATYIWKLDCANPRELSSLINPLIERIKWLRRGNKMNYIREKPDNFIRIEHDYTSDDKGFNKWRDCLDAFLAA